MGRIADGVIVGSALIKRLAGADDPAAAGAAFVGDLRAELDAGKEQPSRSAQQKARGSVV